jgi:hypothetical protein
MGTRGQQQPPLTPGGVLLIAVILAGVALPAQAPGDGVAHSQVSQNTQSSPPEAEPKRIFGLLPNYRTSASLQDYKPLTIKEKFKVAGEDAFDRGTIALSAMFGGLAQLNNAEPRFGHGLPAYARYFGTSYGDFAIGDYMTEAIFPAMLHQDPRYFRRGTGSRLSRLGYAMGQIFWTHKDSGSTQFNYSEVLGNSTATAISEAYYPSGRSASEAVSKFGVQLGVDMASNIIKEFSPEIGRMFSHKHRASAVHPTAVDPKASGNP